MLQPATHLSPIPGPLHVEDDSSVEVPQLQVLLKLPGWNCELHGQTVPTARHSHIRRSQHSYSKKRSHFQSARRWFIPRQITHYIFKETKQRWLPLIPHFPIEMFITCNVSVIVLVVPHCLTRAGTTLTESSWMPGKMWRPGREFCNDRMGPWTLWLGCTSVRLSALNNLTPVSTSFSYKAKENSEKDWW